MQVSEEQGTARRRGRSRGVAKVRRETSLRAARDPLEDRPGGPLCKMHAAL